MPSTTIVVRVDEATPLVCGRVGREGTAPRPFTGWLALMSALQAELNREENERR